MFLRLLYSGLVWLFFLQSSLLADELAPILIVEEAPKKLIRSSPELIQDKLNSIPGGTSFVGQDSIRQSNSRDLQDVLDDVPGIYVRSRFGGDEVRFSIRGSGISQGFNSRGVRFLRDGLPITDAEGIVRSQLIEPFNVNYIEIYRGANALEYGAATLGGAVNFVSPTAYTQDKYFSRLEIGSDNFLRFQTSQGWLLDNDYDLFLSLSGHEQNGFRENSEQETIRLYANAGKRWNEYSESRIHLNIQDSNLELPGSITESLAKSDPSSANAGSLLRNSQRDLNFLRIAYQHTHIFDTNKQLDLGASYQYQEMFLPLAFALLPSNRNDVSLSMRMQQELESKNTTHNLVYGGLVTWGDNDGRQFRFLPDSQNRGSLSRVDGDEAFGAEFYAQDSFEVSKGAQLIIGSQLAYAYREISETSISEAGLIEFEVEQSRGFFGFNPRIGFIKDLSRNIHLFGNVSKSFEPPTTFDLAQVLDNGDVEVLDKQTALTFEIGSRGLINNALNYDIAAYFARVDNEILLQEDPSLPSGSGEFVALNADKTEHTGIEFGLNGYLTDRIELVFAYTFNRFLFHNDDLFEDNFIPGIPPHQIQAELLYHAETGFYFGPAFEYASTTYVDFQNRFDVDTYRIWNFKAGYQVHEDVTVYLNVENIFDEEYVSNAAIVGEATQESNLFNPGQDRSLFVGIEIKF